MVIRCVCGNETPIFPGAKPGYFLRNTDWFDAKSKELRCPKCKSDKLPIELIEASGDIVKVRVVPGRTIEKKYSWA